MEVALSTSGGTDNLTGTVTVTATVTPTVEAIAPVKCEFYVDGVLAATDTSYPLSFSWDTSSLASDSHFLKADVIVGNRRRKAALPVTVLHLVVDDPTPDTSEDAPVLMNIEEE